MTLNVNDQLTINKVSVCILAYQHGPFIEGALYSVMQQQCSVPIEILVGVDPSTDDTAAICDRMASMDERIQVMHRTAEQKIFIDGKPTGRWNVLDLLARATGDAVAILDGDDQWGSMDKLQRQIEALEQDHKAIGAYHGTRIMTSAGIDTGEPWRTALPVSMHLEDTMSGLSPFHLSSFLFLNTQHMRSLPPLIKYTGSFDMLMFSWSAVNGHLVNVPELVSFYRSHEGGLTKSGLFNRSNIHRMRVELWTTLVRTLKGRGKVKAYQVCDKHLDEAMALVMTRKDALRWIRLMCDRPEYFMNGPWRVRKLLPRCSRAIVFGRSGLS